MWCFPGTTWGTHNFSAHVVQDMSSDGQKTPISTRLKVF
jgi:hypothetical protein